MHVRLSHLPQLCADITFSFLFGPLGEYFPKSLTRTISFLPILAQVHAAENFLNCIIIYVFLGTEAVF